MIPGARPATAIGAAVVLLLSGSPLPSAGQHVVDRSPNLAGGWTGTPGSLQLNFNHRFWIRGERIFNSPTFLVALPVTRTTLVGGHYASNSLVAEGTTNEWEVFGRWAPELGWPVTPSVTGAYNVHTGSVDGEVSVKAELLGVEALGAVRGFTDLHDSGDPGVFIGAGAVLPIRWWLSLAGDLGAARREEGESLGRVWGLGLQIRVPTTPHSLSLQATNTRTGTLQGSSVPNRTLWGFEFTAPFTFARFFSEAPGVPN